MIKRLMAGALLLSSSLAHAKNHFGVFLGASSPRSNLKQEDFVAGFDLELRPWKYAGFFAVAERSLSEDPIYVYAGGLKLHLGQRFQAFSGAGVELEEGLALFLFRAGVGYEFEIQKNSTMTPSLAIDFVNGEAHALVGVTFGRGF